jgi:hypothetical protein
MYQIIDTLEDGTLVLFSKDHTAAAKTPRVNGNKVEALSIDDVINLEPLDHDDMEYALPSLEPLHFDRLLNENFVNLLRVYNGQAPSLFHNSLHFAKFHKYWLNSVKKIKDGEVLFVTTSRGNGMTLVVKNQKIGVPDIDFVVTPGPCATELRSLITLNHLMHLRGVAPVFCELLAKEVYIELNTSVRFLSTTMPQYSTDFSAWIYGTGKDPDRHCSGKPPFLTTADPFAPWVYSPCAGHALATSPYKSDVALFNAILRSMLLQVCIGLSQAQRHSMFTHNDLHSGNIMFDTSSIKESRMYATGMGCYLLKPGVPGVRLIDFQHAAFDLYDSSGTCVGRTQGYAMDAANSFALAFDLYRLCTYITLALLRPYWSKLDVDIRAFLLKVSQFGGSVDHPSLPSLSAEVQWAPFLLTGVLPETALLEPVFDSFRCTVTQPANAIFYEVEPSRQAQERYMCARLYRSKNALPAGVLRACIAHTPTSSHQLGVSAFLHSFATNYAGNAMGRVLLMHKHSIQQKWNFLHIQYSYLNAALSYFWTSLQDEIAQCMAADDRAMNICALMDAVVCCIRLDYAWIARPTTLDAYHALVKKYLALHAVQHVIRAPCIATPDALHDVTLCTRDADLSIWRNTLYNAVIQ